MYSSVLVSPVCVCVCVTSSSLICVPAGVCVCAAASHSENNHKNYNSGTFGRGRKCIQKRNTYWGNPLHAQRAHGEHVFLIKWESWSAVQDEVIQSGIWNSGSVYMLFVCAALWSIMSEYIPEGGQTHSHFPPQPWACACVCVCVFGISHQQQLCAVLQRHY